MNKSKLILVLTISILLLNPVLVMVAGVKRPREYVGINEGDEYIWKTEFDKGPMQTYYEDLGFPEVLAEAAADEYFDNNDIKEDWEGLRIYILDFLGEKELEFLDDDIKYMECHYNMWMTEDYYKKSWDLVNHYSRENVYEYGEDVYLALTGWTTGLFQFFVDPDSDWKALVDNFEDELDDFSIEGEAGVQRRTYFFLLREENGISTSREVDVGGGDTKEFESKSLYTSHGVLLYYEFSYDGDTIWKLELENSYIHENWWWLLPIALGISLLAIVVVIVKIKK